MKFPATLMTLFLVIMPFFLFFGCMEEIGGAKSVSGQKIVLKQEGKWDLRTDNRLAITVSGVESPSILFVTVYPKDPQLFMGAVPSVVEEQDNIRGLPIMYRVEKDRDLTLTFSPEVFEPSKWYGQGAPAHSGWVFEAMLTSEVFIVPMPKAGVKEIGTPIILKPDDIAAEFTLLTTFENSSWLNYISPIKSHYISNSPGGMFVTLPKSSIQEKVELLLDKNLR